MSAGEVETFLSAGPAKVLRPTAAAKIVLVAAGGVRMTTSLDILQRLVEQGRIVRVRDGVALAGAVPAINVAESPLALLATRRTRDGSAFLSRREFDAGERLRADYTRARIMPRLGANWEAPISRGKRGGGSSADLTDAALAARQRVDHAIEAVGPELSGVLIDICCFLKGLERVEMERGWPVRSAKVVLKTALGALGRHYFPERQGAARAPLLHWGTDDFRPTIGLDRQASAVSAS